MLDDNIYKDLLLESFMGPNPIRDRQPLNFNRCPACLGESITEEDGNRTCANDHTWHIENGAFVMGMRTF